MSANEHPISDTQRLEAMFHKGWCVRQKNGRFCVPGVTKWKPSPRAAIDAAMAIDAGNALAKVSASTPHHGSSGKYACFPSRPAKQTSDASHAIMVGLCRFGNPQDGGMARHGHHSCLTTP